jgi:hypothetical protein
MDKLIASVFMVSKLSKQIDTTNFYLKRKYEEIK